MHSFLPTYLGGTFFPLLDVSERNFFSDGAGGGEGGLHVHPVQPLPCVRACDMTLNSFEHTIGYSLSHDPVDSNKE